MVPGHAWSNTGPSKCPASPLPTPWTAVDSICAPRLWHRLFSLTGWTLSPREMDRATHHERRPVLPLWMQPSPAYPGLPIHRSRGVSTLGHGSQSIFFQRIRAAVVTGSYLDLVEHCTVLYRKFVSTGLCALEPQWTETRCLGPCPARSQAGVHGLG